MSELPATREYEAHKERNFLSHGAFGIKYVRESAADAMRDELLARIAEMEAELATVNSLLDMKREREQHWSDEAWRYRDELEALMARRCEGCASCDTCPVQNAAWVKFGALEADTGFSCNCWAERKAT